MTKKFTIKRKKRFFENTQFKSFTGFMFVSNYLPKERNPSKPIGLNNTTLYLYKNNFCLLDKFIKYEEVSQFLIDKYGIEENKIFSINKVFLKGTKVIYLVYLDFKTKINNFYEYRTLNMFQKKITMILKPKIYIKLFTIIINAQILRVTKFFLMKIIL